MINISAIQTQALSDSTKKNYKTRLEYMTSKFKMTLEELLSNAKETIERLKTISKEPANLGSYCTALIIIIIEGLSLLQSIPPTTADKKTQAQKRRGSRSRKLLGAKVKATG